MLSKVGIGTANFTQPYGVLSSGNTIDVNSIVAIATDNKINTFDTAFAYGDFLGLIGDKSLIANLNIVTKVSVLDDYDVIFQKMTHIKEQYNLDGHYGLLIHDPQNLEKVNRSNLVSLFNKLRDNNLVKKIGISVYDLNDLENFMHTIEPDLIQIPLNPLNQIFVDDNFIDYVTLNDIEVHARSLFLQGVLLADALPQSLHALEPSWHKYKDACKSYDSRLEALLTWAFSHKWISKWILGVASEKDFLEIINCSKNIKENAEINYFLPLKDMTHPMNDPRNWKVA